MMPTERAAAPVHVGLFATCLVDLTRPSVGFAAVKLLENAGCRVSVPKAQACCGQPAYNSGDNADALAIAKKVIQAFRDFDYVVVPSGSCAGMIKLHFPRLFDGEPALAQQAKELAAKTHELVSFLTDVVDYKGIETKYAAAATYHDSCSGLREMGIKDQPRALLGKVNGLTLNECKENEACCGFGGLFCVKYPDISGRMVDAKVDDIVATGADTLLGGDLGCLMNIAGRLQRRGSNMQVRHIAEVLSGITAGPSIGAPAAEDGE